MEEENTEIIDDPGEAAEEPDFTPEELAELGIEEEKPEPEKSEAEEEPAKTEVEENEENKPVPYDRFAKVYGQKKELEERLKELELKQTVEVKTEPEIQEKSEDDIGDMVVKGGDFDGMTLNEVYAISPARAHRIQLNFENEQREAERQAQDERKKIYEEVNKDIADFGFAFAEESFGKKIDALSEAEKIKVDEATNDLIMWMKTNNKSSYSLVDAHLLRTIAERTKKAREEGLDTGAKSVIDSLRPGQTTKTIGSTAASNKTGNERFVTMSGDQFNDALEKMSSKEFEELMAKAPKELKDKYPDLPWDE